MADKISQKIESAAAKLRKEVTEIENLRAEISGVWTGDNSKKADMKLAAISENLSNRIRELEEAENELL
jgi:hypothetical protein